MVSELKFIWSELQELLEHSAYAVKGEKRETIYEKFPISLKNKDDKNTFTVLKKKFERSQKYRTLNKAAMKPEKPTYSESGTPIYQTESGLSPELELLMYQLLDEQD